MCHQGLLNRQKANFLYFSMELTKRKNFHKFTDLIGSIHLFRRFYHSKESNWSINGNLSKSLKKLVILKHPFSAGLGTWEDYHGFFSGLWQEKSGQTCS